MAKIALDAGHGLYTAGKQTPDGIKEWTLNDRVRDKVVKILSNYDVEIVNTDNDEGETDETLSYRISRYLNNGVDAFVSIHHNALTGDWNNATGVEVYADNHCTAKDLELANAIYNRMVKYTGLRGRGVKKLNFAVINQNKIPAVLCEGGFMDGTYDYKYITSEIGTSAYARAVAEGLIEFLNLKKKEDTTSSNTFADMSNAEIVKMVGPLFTKDQEKSGILASVSMAQFILESSYGKSELAQNANNYFGMKTSLSGNTWAGSTWTGEVYTKTTSEFVDGVYESVNADFRKYPSLEASIADHSAYLLGAKNGSKFRYSGLKGCSDPAKAIQIIKDGGYATAPDYVAKVLNVISTWDLTKYDIEVTEKVEKTLYKVQVGSFRNKEYADGMYYKVKAAGFDACVVKVNGFYKVQTGAFTIKANATKLMTKLNKAGFDSFITTTKGEVVGVSALKSIDEIAKEVIQGKWGTGTDRKNRLTKAGYDYAAVQKRVNELI